MRPNAELLAPGATIDVVITQQAFQRIPEDLSKRRDKFLLQIACVDDVTRGAVEGPFHGYSSIADLWTKVPKSVIFKTKFNTETIIAPSKDLGVVDIGPNAKVEAGAFVRPIAEPMPLD